MNKQLEQLTEDVYVIADHVNHGLIKLGGGRCAVVDTGIDDEAAELILECAGSLSLTLVAIINTHSHADHYGGNNRLIKKTGCDVYAPALESAIMMNPELEAIYIYGAAPPAELTTRFLRSKRSKVDHIIDAGEIGIADKTMTMVTLSGHSPNQIGVLVDGVFFCGDAIFEEKAWEKFVLVYGFDIELMRRSVERVLETQASIYVPSHVGRSVNIDAIAGYNRAKIDMLIGLVEEIIVQPADTASVLKSICDRTGMSITTMQQYYLSLDTLKAYLSYLLAQQRAATMIKGDRLLWTSA